VAGDEPRGTSGEAPVIQVWGTDARASHLKPQPPDNRLCSSPASICHIHIIPKLKQAAKTPMTPGDVEVRAALASLALRVGVKLRIHSIPQRLPASEARQASWACIRTEWQDCSILQRRPRGLLPPKRPEFQKPRLPEVFIASNLEKLLDGLANHGLIGRRAGP